MDLSAVEEVKRLRARYCRAMDQKDWLTLATLYSPDTVLDLRGETVLAGSAEPVRGADAVVAYIRESLGEGICVHISFAPDITLIGPNEARGVWGLEYKVWQPPGSAIPPLHGYAYSYDDYVRIDGVWKMRAVRLKMLWSESAAKA